MKPSYDLPSGQRLVQGLVDQFNTEERLWRDLISKRRKRLSRHPRWSRARRKVLALVNSFLARAAQDCIGFFKNR